MSRKGGWKGIGVVMSLHSTYSTKDVCEENGNVFSRSEQTNNGLSDP